MKVNSAREFRKWRKEVRHRPDVDEDYMGCNYEKDGKFIKGFFNLFHGDEKDDVENYLTTILDIAEDNQAIYEFLQNAVDCGATHFWAFYNDHYFLAVNNGSKFSLDGITSILNIAQSTKKTASDIGRLGIGFKLVHRLVGKGNGSYELVHGKKGPIMFSWDRKEQLASLMSSESISCEGLEENPFLFKIVITNFPANVDEPVKDINFEDTIVFPSSELMELRTYVSRCLGDLYTETPLSFNQGTLFFIKLGENKRQLLDEDLDTLKSGIEYSMNTLKQLSNICFNGENIIKKELILNETSIDKASEKFKEINPQYKDYDILYSFGYLPLDFSTKDYYQSVSQLRQSPNFYKYFPMGDEVDSMALFVHCDSFQIATDRRKLAKHPANYKLLPEIATYIVDILSNYKETNRKNFLQLYASVLLTDKPSSQEKNWMYSTFFDYLFAAIKASIPTITGISTDSLNVKIKKIKMDIPLDQIGLGNFQWFNWYGDDHKEIIAEAKKTDKLGLDEWNINNIIENANIESLNIWLDKCVINLFDQFISEIHAITTSKKVEALLPTIKLFKVGSERKSRDEILADIDYVITTNKIVSIKPILEKIGMKCTDDAIENHLLSSLLKAQDEKILFAHIKEKAEDEHNWVNLLPGDKLSLITTLKGFENVGEESIKQLKIFKNIDGKQCALKDLIAYRDNVEYWQRPYVIYKEECFTEIQPYLVSDDNMFSDVVGIHYDDIISRGTSIDDFYSIYQTNGVQWTDDLTLKMIETYGCTEEVLSLIEKNPSKTAVEEFIKKLDVLKLSSNSNYPKESFEYRCIQIAAKVEAIIIRNKIKIDDTSLTAFTSSNELSFKCKDSQLIEHTYMMTLSDILPDDTQCALYGSIAEKFSTINNYRIIFSANSSDNSVVQRKLSEKLSQSNVVITPAQYLFILLINYQKGNSSFSKWGNLIRFNNENESPGNVISGIISYSYENGLTEAMLEYKTLYLIRPHIQNKYLFSSEYTIDSERAYQEIEHWCGKDSLKKKFLIDLGMHFDDSAEITRRKKFKENMLETWDVESKIFPRSFILWVCTFSTINGSFQKKVIHSICDKFKNLGLSRFYDENNYGEAKELDTQKYLKWKETKTLRIFLINQEMPCKVEYKDQSNEKLLFEDNLGDYHYFPNSQHLYIKGGDEAQISSILTRVYEDTFIPFEYEDYVAVCRGTFEEQKAIEQECESLKAIIKNLKKRLNEDSADIDQDSYKEKERKDYEQTIRDFLGGSFNMSSYNTNSEHIISSYRILQYLKEQGYQIANDFDQQRFVGLGTYKRIKLENGILVNPASAKWGVWYIHPNVWRDIIENGNWACVCTGNGEYDFEIIKSIEDLKEKAEIATNVLMKLHKLENDTIMNVISTVFPGKGNEGMDIHLMLKSHNTPNEEFNSLFDKVFNISKNYNLD